MKILTGDIFYFLIESARTIATIRIIPKPKIEINECILAEAFLNVFAIRKNLHSPTFLKCAAEMNKKGVETEQKSENRETQY